MRVSGSLRTPTAAPSERAAYLRNGKWKLESRAGGRKSDAQMRRELEDKYAEFSRAWVADGTVDPTEENVAKWNSESYPKDSDGNSIVDQIDKTIPGYEDWVRQFLAGEIDELAGQGPRSASAASTAARIS